MTFVQNTIDSGEKTTALCATVHLTSKIGSEEYVHQLFVIEHLKKDLRLDIWESILRPLVGFQLRELNQVPLFYGKHNVDFGDVFRVVATEIVQWNHGTHDSNGAHILLWKRSLTEKFAVLVTTVRFKVTKKTSTPCILFKLFEKSVLVRTRNSSDET